MPAYTNNNRLMHHSTEDRAGEVFWNFSHEGTADFFCFSLLRIGRGFAALFFLFQLFSIAQIHAGKKTHTERERERERENLESLWEFVRSFVGRGCLQVCEGVGDDALEEGGGRSRDGDVSALEDLVR